MIKLNCRVEKVRTTRQLAQRLLPLLDHPDKLGAEDRRMCVLQQAIEILRSSQLISIHAKGSYARVTRKGLHADRSMPPSRRPGRRGWQFAAA